MKTITKTIMYLQMTAMFLTAVLAAPGAAEKQVPFRGSIQAVETNDHQAPTLVPDACGSGNATHLGRFAVTLVCPRASPPIRSTGPSCLPKRSKLRDKKPECGGAKLPL